MSGFLVEAVPQSAVAITLYRYVAKRDELIGCETFEFERGRNGVLTTLLRANISGTVRVLSDSDPIGTYFADLRDIDGSTVATVELDRKSYSALKNRWMRCRVNTDTAN